MSPYKRILIAALLILVICQASFLLYKRGIDRYNYYEKNKLDELLNKQTDYDVLFVGSSKTHFDINPAIVDSVCKLSSYNAGMEGGNLFEFNMIVQAYLQNGDWTSKPSLPIYLKLSSCAQFLGRTVRQPKMLRHRRQH